MQDGGKPIGEDIELYKQRKEVLSEGSRQDTERLQKAINAYYEILEKLSSRSRIDQKMQLAGEQQFQDIHMDGDHLVKLQGLREAEALMSGTLKKYGRLIVGLLMAKGFRSEEDAMREVKRLSPSDTIPPRGLEEIRIAFKAAADDQQAGGAIEPVLDGTQVKNYAEGFLSGTGEKFAHDKIFTEKAQIAFNQGRVLNLIGFGARDVRDQAEEYLSRNPTIGLSLNELMGKLEKARDFLNQVWSDEFMGHLTAAIIESGVMQEVESPEFSQKMKKLKTKIEGLKVKLSNTAAVSQIKAIKKELETQEKELQKMKERKAFLRELSSIIVQSVEHIGEKDSKVLRRLFIDDTRFVAFIFGNKILDPYLYNIGDIASEEHRAIVAHIGTFGFKGAEGVRGGARTIYTTLGRLLGYAEHPDKKEAIEAFRAIMRHEFSDFVRGKHKDEDPTTTALINRVNQSINEKYKTEVVKVVIGDKRGAITVDTDKVSLEKYTMFTDLGTREVFAIKGSSKVHPDVPKGSRKINVMFTKADVGSIGGHGTVTGAMLEAVADKWAEAAEEGKILDFFITRCGDDISITVTHINGKDSPFMHKLAWNGFLNAAVVAKDEGFYGAGQDLLAEGVDTNIRGAGPGITELEFVEREAEPIIVFQADKCGPGIFNEAIRWIYSDPNSAYVSLKPDKAGNVKFGVIDFEGDRTATLDPQAMLGLKFIQAISFLAGEQTRYSFTNLTLDGEDIAGITASRLHNIAGEYTGKDDPGMLVRTQKDLPAEGIFTAPFFKLYDAMGWMMGSQKGYLFPTSIQEAIISVYDGPPLLIAFGFNINNGRLGGFIDLFYANAAIRAVQSKVGEATIELLSSTSFWTQGKGRAPSVELTYQKGLTQTENTIPWQEFGPKKEAASHIEPLAKFHDVAKGFSRDKGMQADIAKALALVGPRAKVVIQDGRPVIIINPLVQEYHRQLGLSFNEEEDLKHESAEAVLLQADKDGILTTQQLLDHIDAEPLLFRAEDFVNYGLESPPHTIREALEAAYDETYGYAIKFNEDPGFAIRHLIAEMHLKGFTLSYGRKIFLEGVLNRLYSYVENTLAENNLSLNKELKIEVIMLPSDSDEATATRQRIGKAENVIGIAREDVAKEIARRKDLVVLEGTEAGERMRSDSSLSEIRQQNLEIGKSI